MRRILPFILALTATVTALSVNAAEATNAPVVPASGHERSQLFMRQKLTYSQGILEGLVLEKYDFVATNATLLRNMNLTNAFFTLGNPTYKAEITSFQGAVDDLSRNVNKHALWPAYEAYNRVTQRCLHCHQQFRREQFLRHNQAEPQK